MIPVQRQIYIYLRVIDKINFTGKNKESLVLLSLQKPCAICPMSLLHILCFLYCKRQHHQLVTTEVFWKSQGCQQVDMGAPSTDK